MHKRSLILILLLFAGYLLKAQRLDSTLLLNLIKADKEEFMRTAAASGLSVQTDTAAKAIIASRKGIVFAKPLSDTESKYYTLALVVSTLDPVDSSVILRKAKPVADKNNTWTDDDYIYIEVNIDQPDLKANWYRFLIYKIK